MFSYKDKTEALQIAVTAGFITIDVAKEEMNKILGREEKRELGGAGVVPKMHEDVACGGVGFSVSPAEYHGNMDA